MCRLFGVLSQDPVNAAYFIKEAPQSLFVQSRIDKKRKQGDGWGIGWFQAGHPQILKSPLPLFSDRAHVAQAIKQPVGKILLGHVRWASNPLKLPRHELIGMSHSQPFSHDSWLFIHNGTLLIPREVKAMLGSWEKFVKGKNDSEVLFYWLLKTVVHGSGKGWSTKIRSSFRQLDRVWQSCQKRYPIYRYPYHGVNWVLTNGRILLAFCYVNPKGFDKAKSLGHPGQPYYQLQFKKTTRNVIVASQSMDRESGWQAFKHGQLLVAKQGKKTISMQTFKVM